MALFSATKLVRVAEYYHQLLSKQLHGKHDMGAHEAHNFICIIFIRICSQPSTPNIISSFINPGIVPDFEGTKKKNLFSVKGLASGPG